MTDASRVLRRAAKRAVLYCGLSEVTFSSDVMVSLIASRMVEASLNKGLPFSFCMILERKVGFSTKKEGC